jgi:hypothetical protein
MYPGYEQYWTAMQSAPDKPLPMTGRLPTPAEFEWARFAREDAALCALEHVDFRGLAQHALLARRQ